MNRKLAIIIIGLAISLSLSATSSKAKQEATPERKKVAVVLSGGGAKGMAHIGALKVIEQAGIPVDYIVGTSMGAIVGALYAVGYSADELDSLVRVQDWVFTLSDKTMRKDKNMAEREADSKYLITYSFDKKNVTQIAGGLIKGENLSDLFNELTFGYQDSIDFSNLPIPFACVSEDITKGEEVVFHSGYLAQAMRASMAIPAVFTPVRIGDRVLVDGGVVNNYPVDVAREMGADIVIGVDVQSPLKSGENLTSTMTVLGQIIDLMGRSRYVENLKKTDTYIRVNVDGYSAASFTSSAINTLIGRGEEAAKEKWDEIEGIKEKIGLSDAHSSKAQEKKRNHINQIQLRNINFEGIDKHDEKWVLRKCGLQNNSSTTMQDIKKAIAMIRANTEYSETTYRMESIPNQESYDLIFILSKKTGNRINLGLRYDSEEMASLLINASATLKGAHTPSAISATARLGKRSAVELKYSLEPSPLTHLNLKGSFQSNDINVYSEGHRTHNASYLYYDGGIEYENVWLHNLRFHLSADYEYYDYNHFLYDSHHEPIDLDREHFFTYSAQITYDTQDKPYFPAHGINLMASYSVYADRFAKHNGHTPPSALMGVFEWAVPITRRFTILPSAYTRLVYGNDLPNAKMNHYGGDILGRYLPEQLPFAGVGHVERAEENLAIAQIKLRQKMGSMHYITLAGNYAIMHDDLSHFFQGYTRFGCSLGYGLDSMFGPLEASLQFANHSNFASFYLNIGFKF